MTTERSGDTPGDAPDAISRRAVRGAVLIDQRMPGHFPPEVYTWALALVDAALPHGPQDPRLPSVADVGKALVRVAETDPGVLARADMENGEPDAVFYAAAAIVSELAELGRASSPTADTGRGGIE